MSRINPPSFFAQRLRVAMAAARLSSGDIAAACNVSRQAVHRWMIGASHPTSANLSTVCRETGASLEWMLQPAPVDVRGTDTAPGGTHIKTLIRQVLAEMAEEAA